MPKERPDYADLSDLLNLSGLFTNSSVNHSRINQMFGINQESFVFFQPKGCTSSMGDDLRTSLYVVSLSLFFKLVLFTGVRFIVLRDQTIDMVNILHYLIKKWSWIVLAQLVSSACIVYILLLNQSGVDIVSDVLSRNCTVEVIE